MHFRDHFSKFILQLILQINIRWKIVISDDMWNVVSIWQPGEQNCEKKSKCDTRWPGGINVVHITLNSPEWFWSCTLTMMRWKGGLADSSSPGTAGDWSRLTVSRGPAVTSSLKTTAGCCPLPRASTGSFGPVMWISRTTTSGTMSTGCEDLDVVRIPSPGPWVTRPEELEAGSTSC